MILSYQKVEILNQQPGEVGMKKHIERAARTCYKSEDKTTDDSYERIFKMLCDNEHLAALEHGTVYLFAPIDCSTFELISFYQHNPYSRVALSDTYAYITTNYRVIHENKRYTDLYFRVDKPTEFHEKRVTVKFIADISVTREANRHRVNSMCEESTIYCNYSRDKFGGEVSISVPVWLTSADIAKAAETICPVNSIVICDPVEVASGLVNGRYEDWGPIEVWLAANIMAEFFYMQLIKKGWTAKQARTVLPLDTKSELIHTAFVDDWQHFFKLRCAEAHPQIKDLAIKLRNIFIENKLIKPIND